MANSRTALALLLAIVLAPAPARAAAPRTLTVRTAARLTTAHADFTLPANVKVAAAPRLTTTGHFAVAFVEWLDDPHLAWGVVLTNPAFQPITFGHSYGVFPAAGRYRVHVASDGASTFVLPLSGLRRSANVTATAPTQGVATAAFDRVAAPQVANVAAPTIDRHTGVPLPARYLAVVARQWRVSAPDAVTYENTCLVPAGEPCESASGSGQGEHATSWRGQPIGHLVFLYDDVAPVRLSVTGSRATTVDAILEAARMGTDPVDGAVLVLLDRGPLNLRRT